MSIKIVEGFCDPGNSKRNIVLACEADRTSYFLVVDGRYSASHADLQAATAAFHACAVRLPRQWVAVGTMQWKFDLREQCEVYDVQPAPPDTLASYLEALGGTAGSFAAADAAAPRRTPQPRATPARGSADATPTRPVGIEHPVVIEGFCDPRDWRCHIVALDCAGSYAIVSCGVRVFVHDDPQEILRSLHQSLRDKPDDWCAVLRVQMSAQPHERHERHEPQGCARSTQQLTVTATGSVDLKHYRDSLPAPRAEFMNPRRLAGVRVVAGFCHPARCHEHVVLVDWAGAMGVFVCGRSFMLGEGDFMQQCFDALSAVLPARWVAVESAVLCVYTYGLVVTQAAASKRDDRARGSGARGSAAGRITANAWRKKPVQLLAGFCHAERWHEHVVALECEGLSKLFVQGIEVSGGTRESVLSRLRLLVPCLPQSWVAVKAVRVGDGSAQWCVTQTDACTLASGAFEDRLPDLANQR